MSDVLVARSELSFLLWDWLGLERQLERPEFRVHDRETVEAVLELSTELAGDVFLTHYKAADREEPRLDGHGSLRVLPAIHEALGRYAELGLFGASFPADLGGLGLPTAVVSASMAQFMAANVSTAVYAMLTVANARLIAAFGTPEQVEVFARPQVEGRAFGTMCLSETQAGSSLGDIRTRAVADGEDALGARHRLFGSKMWISGGDHDVVEDITHLVLAKVAGPDGALPGGSAGISLFIVPKRLPGGARNDVAVAGLNHKMGCRGMPNCLLNFGEAGEGALGWLVGREGQGLALMFQMMNEARINVGVGAAAIAYRGYRHSLAYARERRQGRRADGSAPAHPAALIEHADVQRMLLAQKCYAEGGLALVLYCSRLVDDAAGDEDAAELLSLLTPVAKTWPSEWGCAANDLAIQVHGGYGYTRDFDVEQLYRDNRLNPIHEGTSGIQAIDLVGRKLLRSNGRGFAVLAERVRATVAAATGAPLSQPARALEAAWAQVEATVEALRTDPGRALANATSFMQGFGHVVMAWLWLDQAVVCERAAPTSDAAALRAGKLRACRFFYECELPKARLWLEFAATLSDVAHDVPADEF